MIVTPVLSTCVAVGKRIGEEGTTFFFSFFFSFRSQAHLYTLASIDCSSWRYPRGKTRSQTLLGERREGGREGTYNVATSSRRLDAGFGTVQQVDEQVSRFPSFEFAFPSLRRVVAARFSFTSLLRDTTPFGYHLS